MLHELQRVSRKTSDVFKYWNIRYHYYLMLTEDYHYHGETFVQFFY